jgi:hypothetical protein
MSDSKKRARDEQEVQRKGCMLITSGYSDEGGSCSYTKGRYQWFDDEEDAVQRLLALAYAAKYCDAHLSDSDLDDNLEAWFEAMVAAHPDKAGLPRTDVDWGALLPANVQAHLRKVGGFKVVEHCSACLRYGTVFTWEADDGGAQWTLRFKEALAPPPPLAEDACAPAPAPAVDAVTNVVDLSDD